MTSSTFERHKARKRARTTLSVPLEGAGRYTGFMHDCMPSPSGQQQWAVCRNCALQTRAYERQGLQGEGGKQGLLQAACAVHAAPSTQ